jgi:hypothetical protein
LLPHARVPGRSRGVLLGDSFPAVDEALESSACLLDLVLGASVSNRSEAASQRVALVDERHNSAA